mgnify:CR=1 FL=1
MSQDEKTPLLINESINGDGEPKVVIKPIYSGNNVALLWFNDMYVKLRTGFSLKLFLMLLGLIFVGTANRVAFKIMSNATLLRVRYDEKGNLVVNPKYSTFIAQVTNFIYMPVFWPIVWYFMLKTKRITPEMRQFPVWKYAVMGALDSLAGILMVCGGAKTSGPLQQLLIQGAIPFTMLFSVAVGLGIVVKIFGPTFKVRYRWSHLVGAGLIISGIVLALVPQFLPKKGKAAEESGSGTSPPFAIMFFLATIPTAFSNVFKEIAFKGTDLDIYLVNAWVATFQFIIGFPLLPLGITVEKNPLQALKDLPKEFYQGMLCFIGLGEDGELCVQRLVMVHILVYLFINIFYNIFVLSVLKYGSASLLQISSAMLLPLANITFTIKGIMNEFKPHPPEAFVELAPYDPQYVPKPPGYTPPPAIVNAPTFNEYQNKLSGYDIGGLVMILVGLGFYRALSEGGGEEEQQEDKTTVVVHTEHEYTAIPTVVSDNDLGRV